jgi:hypothetical protein
LATRPQCVVALSAGRQQRRNIVGVWEDYASQTQLKTAFKDADIALLFAVTRGNEPAYDARVVALGRTKVVTSSSDSSDLRDVLGDGLDCG